jgi:hypothetical protein
MATDVACTFSLPLFVEEFRGFSAHSFLMIIRLIAPVFMTRFLSIVLRLPSAFSLTCAN